MELTSSKQVEIVRHTISQLREACDMLQDWNKAVTSVDDYVTSSGGMQKLAASCMLLESIGEGVKKIDRLIPGFLQTNEPMIPWKEIKGLRDHIAHGYFNIDADIVFDVVHNELSQLNDSFVRLLNKL